MSQHPHETPDIAEVTVIGAGMIGLITALQFAKRGLHVVLIDDVKDRKLSYKVGESLLVFSNMFLRTIGELDDFCEDSYRKVGILFMHGMEGAQSLEDQSQWALLHVVPKRWRESMVTQKHFRAMIKDVQIVRPEAETKLFDIVHAHPNITFMDTARVKDVKIREDGSPHELRWIVKSTGELGQLRSRWVIDCSGRVRMLAKKMDHKAEKQELNDGFQTTALWAQFGNIKEEFFDERWTVHFDDDKELEQANYTTLHLWGDGYWLWSIRLAGERISIGVTYDKRKPPPGATPKEQFWNVVRRYPLFDEMLSEENLLEFNMFKNVQYMTDTFVSEHRYGMVGDAAAIIDAYYSQGMSLAMSCAWHIANIVQEDVQDHRLDTSYIERVNRYTVQDWHLMRYTVKDKYTSAIADGRFFALSHWLDMCMIVGLAVPRLQILRWLVETGGETDKEQPIHVKMRKRLKKNLFFTRALPWRILPPELITRWEARMQRKMRERAMWRLDNNIETSKVRSIIRVAAGPIRFWRLLGTGRKPFVDISPKAITNEPEWMRVKGTEMAPLMLGMAAIMMCTFFGIMYTYDAVATGLMKLKVALFGAPAKGAHGPAESQEASQAQEPLPSNVVPFEDDMPRQQAVGEALD